MARTKLTKRARDAKQQEAVKRRQRQTASEKEMRMAESIKRHGNFNDGDVKIRPVIPQPFQKKQVKQGGKIIREMIVRLCAVFSPSKKDCITISFN